jgi:hypothetical protein
MMELHRAIWEVQNIFVHRQDAKKAQERARQVIFERVMSLYDKPPKWQKNIIL